jgi:hypothetical protein
VPDAGGEPPVISKSRPEFTGQAAGPPFTEPIRKRTWLLVLLALAVIWVLAKSRNQDKQFEVRINQAIAMTGSCNIADARAELASLKASKARPEQWRRLQNAISQTAPACEKKRLRAKAWSDTTAAAERALSMAAPDRAASRLAQFTQRWGEDAETRELADRIDSRRAGRLLDEAENCLRKADSVCMEDRLLAAERLYRPELTQRAAALRESLSRLVEQTPKAPSVPVIADTPSVPAVRAQPPVPVIADAPRAPPVRGRPSAPVIADAPRVPSVRAKPPAPVTANAPRVPAVRVRPPAPVTANAPRVPAVRARQPAPVIANAPRVPAVRARPPAPVIANAPRVPAVRAKPPAPLIADATRVPAVRARPPAPVTTDTPPLPAVRARPSVPIVEDYPRVLESEPPYEFEVEPVPQRPQRTRRLLADARRDLEQGDYKGAIDKLDTCATMIDAGNRQCQALRQKAERLNRDMLRCVASGAEWVDDQCL